MWLLFACFFTLGVCVHAEDIGSLKKDQRVASFKVNHLYADAGGKIVGAQFLHEPSQAPFYVIQIETAPQAFVWIDTPQSSNRGLAHALEHLLVRKGITGRYLNLLRIMRFGELGAASYEDYNLFSISSGTGIPGFTEEFRALLKALYQPDFTDTEAEREFYHLAVDSNPKTRNKNLTEQGTVYNEMQTGQEIYRYYFDLNKEMFGDQSPFGFSIGGVPSEMRDVTPQEIREFHAKHYRLGKGTGFICVLPPAANVTEFLSGISAQLGQFPLATDNEKTDLRAPRYRVRPSDSKKINIYSFPSANDNDRGDIAIGWAPAAADSPLEVRLLELLLQALSDGERSLLYKSLIASSTRQVDSGVTGIQYEVLLRNSPWFPAASIDLGGIPGKQINASNVEKIRQQVSQTIKQVSEYQDNSPQLEEFNQLIRSYAGPAEKRQKIWIRNSPLFTRSNTTEWKEHLRYVDMESSFVIPLADTPIWKQIDSRTRSGKNIWRELIAKYHLLEEPYTTASAPSERLLAEMEQQRKARIQREIEKLEDRFGTRDEQEALKQLEILEAGKTEEVEKIEARVPRPHLSEHPPLTADDGVQYKQVKVGMTPVIAVLFNGTPTIDLGLAFDLRRVPKKFYKYLPILPKCFDSLGLKTSTGVVSYSDLIQLTERTLSSFSVDYSSSSWSPRADLEFRWGVASQQELQESLSLMTKILSSGNLNMPNLNRLRDLVNERVSDDDRYAKDADSTWYFTVANTFRHQNDELYLALNSRFTQAHWNNRLQWALHAPVTRSQVDNLGRFADQVLASSSGLTGREISSQLSKMKLEGLENELVQYWQRNIDFLPSNGLTNGLQQLTEEVEEDLKTGPERTLEEIKNLSEIVVRRENLKLDITLDPSLLPTSERQLEAFVQKLHSSDLEYSGSTHDEAVPLVMRNVKQRTGQFSDEFPLYLGFEVPHSVTGGVVFMSDFLSNSQLDRPSLINFLGSLVGLGTGPHTFYMRTFERGLAYSNGIVSDPNIRRLMYYADRAPDLTSLVNLVNSVAAEMPKIEDPDLIDYIMKKAFPAPRSIEPFANRGKDLTQNIYDGNDPAKVRRFSEAILELRHNPGLLSEILKASSTSIAPVMLDSEFKSVQHSEHSIFFFFGPERLISDAEKKLAMPRLLRIYPADFWIRDGSHFSSRALQNR